MRKLAFLVSLAACTPTTAPAFPPAPPAHLVTATILLNHCANLDPASAKLTQAAMSQLVDACSSFSGGGARFTATLLPGGAIQFEPRTDHSESIPICVLSHPLMHKVHLKTACGLDVQLEETSISLQKSTPGDHK